MNTATIIVLIVVLVLMLVMPYFTQKKRNKEYMDMLSGIKVGDLVKTAGGIIGKINKITDKGEVRTVVIETGSKTQKSYLEMDITMIYCVLNKTTKTENAEKVDVAEKSIDNMAEEKTKTEEKPTENVDSENIEKNSAEKVEEKKSAKKSATKKAATKSTKKSTAAKKSTTTKKDK